MPLYRYKARDMNGAPVAGDMEAHSEEEVARFIRGQQWIPIDIRPAPPSHAARPFLERFLKRPIPREQIAMFCQQMYTLLHAGVPLMSAIESLRDTYGPHTPFGRILGGVRDDLDAGYLLSRAMAHHPEAFDDIVVNLVEVGEATGNLDRIFLQLGEYLRHEEETIARVKQALRYPAFVLVAIALAVAIINYLVIPQFARLFENARVPLPLPTRILIAVNRFSVDYWWLILGTALLLWAGFAFYIHTSKGRWLWDRFRLRMPLLGSIILKSTLARFARTLALTYQAGVPILQGLELVSRSVANRFLETRILEMRRHIEQGASMAQSAQAVRLFPPLVLQMIAVGEVSGSIDDLMTEVADFYEREANYEIDRLAARIEPLLLAVLAGMVLVLALGVYLPVWELIKVVR